MSYQSITVTPTPELIASGQQKIEWARNHMPIISYVIQRFNLNQPLSGHTVVTSVHMEAKTANLVQALASLGAEVFATGCNPLSTQDDVAVALAETPHVTVFAKHNCSEEEYWEYLKEALRHRPHIIIDDGGDLVKLLHGECADYGDRLVAGCEETTTGIHRLKILAEGGKLKFPMYSVNDADCKHLFDNHHGTGQSVMDGILRTTNLIVAGKTVVVAGYGDCGSGIAKRMRGMGAHVIVTEIDPVKALRAYMDGYSVTPMNHAAYFGDIFITATGCKDVITKNHFEIMKDGAILANAGHFDVEINIEDLTACTVKHYEVRKNITAYEFSHGKTLNLLAEGRLVNLAAADGHAVEIMDMSFSIQLLCAIDIAHWITEESIGHHTPPGLYSVPSEINTRVAELALQASNIAIDELTNEQRKYLENGF